MLGGPHDSLDPWVTDLFARARICQAFPAYKLHELRDTPARELYQAMELLGTAAKLHRGAE